MGLTAKEQAEYDALNKEVGHLAPKLSPDEQAEYATLQKQVGHLLPAGGGSPNDPSIARTALDQGANAAAFNYLPQLQAGAARGIVNVHDAVAKGVNALRGAHDKSWGGTPSAPMEDDWAETSPSYVDIRDKSIQQLAAEQKANPATARAAQIGGSVVGALATPLPGVGAAKGIMSGIAQGAKAGALQGLIQNPGDVQGEVSPLQLTNRLENAGTGAVVGGVTGGATEAARKGLKYVSELPSKLRDTAEGSAVKASGAMLKDFRALEGKDRTNQVGRFARDKGIVQATDTFKDVAEKADAARQEAGSRLSNIYKSVVEDFDKGGGNLSKEEIAKINTTGFNPARDKDQILSEVSKAMGNQEGKKAAVGRLGSYFDQLIEDHGDKILDPKLSQEVKTEIDKVAGWARNPLTKEPATESAYKEARRIISRKIDEDIDRLGKASGNPDALKQLKQANSDYGNAKQLSDFANDYNARVLANRRTSLTDTIAGGAGGIAGTTVAGLMGKHDPYELGGAGLIGGLLAGGANHLGRKYGSGLIAGGADTLAPLSTPFATMARGANAVLPSAGLMGRLNVSTRKLNEQNQK